MRSACRHTPPASSPTVSGNSLPLTVCTDTTGTVPYPSNPCGIDDLTENSLDVEWAGSTAKGANIVLVASYPASASDDTLYDSEYYIVSKQTASIMNVSYGACELDIGTAGNVLYYNLWQTASTEGIAVFVAAGDAGSADCDTGGDVVGNPYSAQYGLSVNGLASTPFNTAMGGTDFNWCPLPSATQTTECTAAPYWNSSNAANGSSAMGYVPEVPWNDTCANPLAVGFLEQWAESSDAGSVGGVTDTESACNFVYNYWQTVQTNTGGSSGVDLAYIIDAFGGGGGASGCVVNDGSNVSSCDSSTTTTGSGNGSIPLYKDGWPKPSWQTGVAGIPSDGVRDLPDVSFFASDGFLSGSSYLICVSEVATCTYSTASETFGLEVGGTSVASTVMAGVMALINQKAGEAQGSPNAELYMLAASQTYANCSAESVTAGSASCYFNDIDANTNAMPCDYGAAEGNPSAPGIQSPNCSVIHTGDLIGILPGYSAVTGYDQATGLGSLNIANVVDAWPAATATGTATVTVTPAQTTLSASSALSVPVTVTSTSETTPTGTVTLLGGGYTSGAEPLSSGAYTFSIPANSLSVGSDLLTVSYSGDASTLAAIGSATVTVTGSTPSSATFTLSASSPSSVDPGSTATSTVTVSSSDGYAGTVTLACALTTSPSGATDPPTCSAGSSTVTLSTTTTSGMATVTVSTTAPSSSSAFTRPGPGKGKGWAGAGGGAVLAFLILLGIPARRRKWRSMLGAVALMAALGGLAGCGDFWQSPYTSSTTPGTTAGTYTFTVTGSGDPAVTPAVTTTFTVTVNTAS